MEFNESAASLNTEPLIRVRILLAYDGKHFHGFAYQKGDVPTVAGALRSALKRLMGYEPELAVAGRTDTGVHAWGQVVSLDIPKRVIDRFGYPRMQRSINRQLAPRIVVREIAEASADFHARHSATLRRYRYSIYNATLPSPFNADTSWWIEEELDIEAMNSAAKAIVGEHDFSSFCRRPTPDTHLTRRIVSAHWRRMDETETNIRFDIDANAFCHQMVRSLTGMLVAIGRGKRQVNSMAEVLLARDRHKAAPLAPPHGLCLWEVQFKA